VLTNNVIDLIANKRPRNLFEFRTLSGIGEAKMKKYGPRIVELVKAILSGRSELNLGPNIVLSPEDEKYLQEADAAAKLQKKKKAVTEKKILKTVKKLSKKGYCCCLYVCTFDLSIYLYVCMYVGANETAIILSIEQLREEAKRSDGLITFSELNKEQQNAAKQALLGKNVFITGSAGTGTYINTYIHTYKFSSLVHTHLYLPPYTCMHAYVHRSINHQPLS
jgi:hypothetical protein